MSERPHILVVMSDDHAQWAAGCYGNREIRTPTLDHLADSGVLMSNSYTPTTVCSPARASFFTGLLPSQHGIHDFIRATDDVTGTRDWLGDTPTLATILQAAGYRTGLIGKWHCGRDDVPQPGFDTWFSVGRTYPYHGGPHTYCDNGAPLELSGHKTQIITDRAVEFLRARDDRPLFLFVGYTATHSPWGGHPERLVSGYRGCAFGDIPRDSAYPFGTLRGEGGEAPRLNPREALAQYYAAVSQIDEGVGRLVDELEGLGLRERTLLVYTSDHGLCCGHHGLWGKGNATRPLNMLEESIRIPLIFSRPGVLLPGQRRAEPADLLDLFATILDEAGVAPPPGHPYSGQTLLPTLRAGQPLTERRQIQLGEYGDLRMARTERYKLVRRYPAGPCELFDLRDDPRETANLFEEPALQTVVSHLTAAIDEHFARYEDATKSGLRVRELPSHNPVEAWRA